MITDALQQVLDPICTAYSPIVDSDILPSGAFCVHQEDVAEVLRDKVGVFGFIYNVTVTVVADSQSVIDPILLEITDAIELMKDTTIASTIIEDSRFESSQGVTFDDEKKKYFDQLVFSVQTKNR